MQTVALFLPEALPLLKLMQGAAESTVAATKGWHLFFSSRPQHHTEQRWQAIPVPFVLPGHHLICLKQREERPLIKLKSLNYVKKKGDVTLLWALCQFSVYCLFLIKGYAIVIQLELFFVGGKISQTHKI